MVFDVFNTYFVSFSLKGYFCYASFVITNMAEPISNTIFKNPTIVSQSIQSFSVDFNKGIPMYLQFLQEITLKLENSSRAQLLLHATATDEPILKSLQYLFEMMVRKARYFLEEILDKHLFEHVVSDDVLFGLHFIILNYYFGDVVKAKYLSLARLLENRTALNANNEELKGAAQRTNSLFPAELQQDFFKLMISDCSLQVPSDFTSQGPIFTYDFFAGQPSWEEDIVKMQQFITEHIIDLSRVVINISIEEFVNTNYLNFMKSSNYEDTTPTKDVDLFFHYHMLNTYNFIQDSYTMTGVLRDHRLLFFKVAGYQPLQDNFLGNF